MAGRAPERTAEAPPLWLGGQVALFDLDRTLVPGSSVMAFGRELVRRGLVQRRKVVRHVGREAVFSRGLGEGRVDRLRSRALAAVAGRHHEELVEVARDVGAELAAQAYAGGRWLLERHRASGDFCVIVSASPQELVEIVARGLGAHRAVGTRAEVADGRCTGRLEGPLCHGPGKLVRLEVELGPLDLVAACAYSDSSSDLPLLSACGRPVAVNADRRLRAAAQASGWPVITLG